MFEGTLILMTTKKKKKFELPIQLAPLLVTTTETLIIYRINSIRCKRPSWKWTYYLSIFIYSLWLQLNSVYLPSTKQQTSFRVFNRPQNSVYCSFNGSSIGMRSYLPPTAKLTPE